MLLESLAAVLTRLFHVPRLCFEVGRTLIKVMLRI